jgi:hypothetical protein
MVLRRQLYLTAVDVKGLLLRSTPLEIILLALTGAAFALIFLGLKNDRGSSVYEENYMASVPAGLGHVAAATGFFMLIRGSVPAMVGVLNLIWKPLGMAAAVCLILAGVLRLLGKKPFFLPHVAVCLFFLVHIVTRYQLWSANPQMQDYVFALLGAMALMFFGFYNASQEAELGNQRMKLGMGLAAVYLCLAELARSSCPALYLGGILWVLTELCGIRYVSEEKK